MSAEAVAATRIADDCRPAFLSLCFGPRFMLRGESLVYAWLRQLFDADGAGHWHFYELSNGGFYLAPALPGPLRLDVEGSHFSGDFSSDAAGVVVTLFALGDLAAMAQGSKAGDRLTDHHLALREFAKTHCESSQILNAIDCIG
nr:antirestriction protein [Variovorax paradoxus]